MNPFVLAAVSGLLCVATGAGFAVQLASASARQASGLVMQGGMTLMMGAMAVRFWTRGRIARQMQRERDEREARERGETGAQERVNARDA